MNDSLGLSIVMPMYNEASAILVTLQRLLKMFRDDLNHVSFEIIVVDDRSSDDSAMMGQQINDTAVRLYQHPNNIGNGAAIKTSIRQAQGDMQLFLDADGHCSDGCGRFGAKVDGGPAGYKCRPNTPGSH